MYLLIDLHSILCQKTPAVSLCILWKKKKNDIKFITDCLFFSFVLWKRRLKCCYRFTPPQFLVLTYAAQSSLYLSRTVLAYLVFSTMRKCSVPWVFHAPLFFIFSTSFTPSLESCEYKILQQPSVVNLSSDEMKLYDHQCLLIIATILFAFLTVAKCCSYISSYLSAGALTSLSWVVLSGLYN